MEARIENNTLVITGIVPQSDRGIRIFFHPHLKVLLLRWSEFGISPLASNNSIEIPLSRNMIQELPRDFKDAHFSTTVFSIMNTEYYLLVPNSRYTPTPKQVVGRIEEFWEIIPNLNTSSFVNKPEIILEAGKLQNGAPRKQNVGLWVLPKTRKLKWWILDLTRYQISYGYKDDIVAIVPYDALTIDGLVPARGGVSSYFFSLSRVDRIRTRRYGYPPLTNRLITTYVLEQDVLYLKLGIPYQR